MNAPARNLDLATALDAARSAYVAAHPESQRIAAEASQVMPGGNTRTVLHYGPFPFVVERGEGAVLYDADGHAYDDFLGEYSAGLYGHNNPVIEAAVIVALKAGIVRGGPNAVDGQLARLMCERFAAVERVRFCNSGTEANILALSAARAFTGRTDVVVMQGGYHGGVLMFGGDHPLNLPMPFHRARFNDAAASIALIRGLGDRLAAVLVEPIMGAGGVIPAEPGFLEALREVTRETGALLIFDEVMTSRHTAGGMQGYYGVTPDLATFGKYLGGGLTFGAFGGRAEFMERFNPYKPGAWGHAGTFNNNVLSMTAGYTGLSQVFTPEVADAHFARGNRFRDSLRQAVAKLDVPVQISGLGSLLSLHFAAELPTAPGLSAGVPDGLFELVHLDMIERGQFLARRGYFTVSLPTADAAMERFRGALTDVLELRAALIREAVAG